jgi:hypothetical protein
MNTQVQPYISTVSCSRCKIHSSLLHVSISKRLVFRGLLCTKGIVSVHRMNLRFLWICRLAVFIPIVSTVSWISRMFLENFECWLNFSNVPWNFGVAVPSADYLHKWRQRTATCGTRTSSGNASFAASRRLSLKSLSTFTFPLAAWNCQAHVPAHHELIQVWWVKDFSCRESIGLRLSSDGGMRHTASTKMWGNIWKFSLKARVWVSRF